MLVEIINNGATADALNTDTMLGIRKKSNYNVVVGNEFSLRLVTCIDITDVCMEYWQHVHIYIYMYPLALTPRGATCESESGFKFESGVKAS